MGRGPHLHQFTDAERLAMKRAAQRESQSRARRKLLGLGIEPNSQRSIARYWARSAAR